MDASPQLAAIWFADLVGYAQLTWNDEDGALAAVETFQNAVRTSVEERGGRIVKWTGDGAMACFPSTRAALAAAIALRESFGRDSPVGIRLGMHVGDVVGSGDGDLYGDGVNVAARLESEASPGQILVSEDVWRQMRQRPGFAFRPLGERRLKGTAPLEVYEVVEQRSAAASPVHRVAEDEAPSLAVLPFLNMSGDPQNEFFADGVTEDIIAALARIHGLKVISRTSAMRYRGTTKSLREIGGELGVTTILEGSVRLHGDRVRIVAQLADARTDGHLWAETYDRNLEDIFAIQTDVANRIAEALEMSLSPRERERIAGSRRENVEAYEKVLLARYHWNQRTREGLQKAIELFEAAIATAPDFPLAYSGLADVWVVIATYSPFSRRDAITRGAEAAQRAVELDPTLGEAHAALGAVATARCQWEEADRHFQRALELSPGYATAHQWYGESLTFRRRFAEAAEQIRRAEELDPCSLIIKVAAARPYLASGRLDEAVRRLRRVLDADPAQPHAHALLAQAYHAMGRYEESIDEMVAWEVIPWLDAPTVEAFRSAYAEGGVERYLRTALRIAVERDAPPIYVAAIHVGLDEPDRAIDVLESAIEGGDPSMRGLVADPLLVPLYGHPRFIDLCGRLGVPPPTS